MDHINKHLVCPLCDGYFRDPYTIAQCGETFCKSCLFNKLHVDNVKTRVCPNPLCQMREPLKVAGTDYIGVEADHQKRAILDLIFPEWREKDEIKREEFYRSRNFIKKCEVDKGEAVPAHVYNEGEGEGEGGQTGGNAEERLALKLGYKRQAVSGGQSANPLSRTPSNSSSSKLSDSRTIKALIDKRATKDFQLPQIEKPLLRIPCKSMMSKLSFHIAKKLFASRNKNLDLSTEGKHHKNVKLVSDLIVLKYISPGTTHEGHQRTLEKTTTAGDSFPVGSFSSDASYLEVFYSCTTQEDADMIMKILSDLPAPAQETTTTSESAEEVR